MARAGMLDGTPMARAGIAAGTAIGIVAVLGVAGSALTSGRVTR